MEFVAKATAGACEGFAVVAAQTARRRSVDGDALRQRTNTGRIAAPAEALVPKKAKPRFRTGPLRRIRVSVGGFMHRTPLYLAIALAGFVSLPLAAVAQEANADRKDATELEGVVVTGSRIP